MLGIDKKRAICERTMKLLCSAAAAILFVAALPHIAAVNELPILGSEVNEESVVLYLGGAATEQQAEAQIGTDPVGSVELHALDASTPIVTWLLMDNSRSIVKADREKANELMTNIVAGRLPNERITLCTISDRLHILLRESESYAELKAQIDSIQYEDQDTYLTDVLNELLDDERGRTESAYVRCIVISDGVDNNPGGITREELTKRLAEKNLPIYTFGCKGGDSELKAMYAISRQTCAKNWALSELTDMLSVSSTLGTTELPVRTAISIPEALRDGTTKGVRVVLSDGTTAETQLKMPFGIVTKPDLQPQPKPNPEPKEEVKPVPPVLEPTQQPEAPQKSNTLLFTVIAVAAAVAVGVLAWLLLRKKKENARIRTVSDAPAEAQNTEIERTEYLGAGKEHTSETMLLVGSERTFMLSLTDIEHPEKHFEAPLRKKVTIGRNPNNQIVLDYDKSVSSFHCEIFVNGNSLWIKDLQSKNGICIDGAQVTDSAEIANGSTIKLGRVLLKVSVR